MPTWLPHRTMLGELAQQDIAGKVGGDPVEGWVPARLGPVEQQGGSAQPPSPGDGHQARGRRREQAVELGQFPLAIHQHSGGSSIRIVRLG